MKNSNIIGLLLAVLLITGAIAYLERGRSHPALSAAPATDLGMVLRSGSMEDASSTPASMAAGESEAQRRIADKETKYERAKEIVAPSGFVNTGGKPIKLSDYVGKKVILLDIMTYSCINCIRTFPYINEWYSKYEDKGLVVIGIHTPEFEFEKDIANVEAAMKKYGIKFPVVLDNDYGTWSAYKNLYWPRKYLIDIDGFIRYDHVGEGGYAETESAIQELLSERAKILGESGDVKVPLATDPKSPVDAGQTPETYIGSARNEYLGNGFRGKAGTQTLSLPSSLERNRFYLSGTWDIEPEYASNSGSGASIVYPFYASKAYLVASADSPVDVEVRIDGKPVVSSKGDDVSASSTLSVSASRLYSVYDSESPGPHVLELAPLSKGLKAFAFTFGG